MFKHILVALSFMILSAKALAANDVRASNCEIFIDKVAGRQVAYHGAFGAIVHGQVLVKIDLSKTGPIRRVVFYSNQKGFNGSILKTETGFRDVELPSYFGAPDYFVAELGDLQSHWWDNNDDYVKRQVHEGAFFVERLDGVRLWANPESSYGPHFLFDALTAATLIDNGQIYIGNGSYPYGAARLRDLNEVKQTADYNTYWNPGRCR